MAARTPTSCEVHQPDYKAQAWEAYSFHELGYWVHLFSKRASHRNVETARAKAEKDLTDAQNYLNMMQSKLDEVRVQVLGVEG